VATAHVSSHDYGNTAAAAAIKDSAEQLERALLHIIEARQEVATPTAQHVLPQTYLKMAVPYVRSAQPPQRCRATRSSVFVDPSGIVYPCNSYSRVLGTLRESNYSLRAILDRPGID